MNGLSDDEKGFPAQPVDPIVSRAAQAQLLPRHIEPRQWPQTPMVDPHVPIDVEEPYALFFRITLADRRHPFLGQPALPLGGASLLLTENPDLLPQGLDFGQPIL